MIVVVLVAVSSALIAGAMWGVWGNISTTVEGVVLSIAGGALVTSLAFELVEPATESAGVVVAMSGLALGAAAFTAIDFVVDERWEHGGGFGLLVAVTLDGVPENLALGVALIGSSGGEVAALAAAIMLSNLPEAAGGARDMRDDGWRPLRAVGLWTLVAVVLAAATLVGNLTLTGVPGTWLGGIQTFAAGAVLASLATEVFPQSFRDAGHWSGVATAAGFVMTFLLSG